MNSSRAVPCGAHQAGQGLAEGDRVLVWATVSDVFSGGTLLTFDGKSDFALDRVELFDLSDWLKLPSADAIQAAAYGYSTRKDQDSVGALAWNFLGMFKQLAAKQRAAKPAPDLVYDAFNDPLQAARSNVTLAEIAAAKPATPEPPSTGRLGN